MKKIIIILLSIFLVLSTPYSAFAKETNKAARIKTTYQSIPQSKKKITQDTIDHNTFVFETSLKSPSKLTKKSTMSFKMLFPKTMFKTKNDDVAVTPLLVAVNDSKLFRMFSEYSFCLKYNGAKVSLEVWDTLNNKKISSKKYATLKKSGNYYVLIVKDVPVVRSLYSDRQKQKSIPMSKFDTKEEYSLFAQIKTAYGMEKKGNSYLYLDDLTVKTTKTQTVTYNNKTTYNYLEGFNYYDGYENDKTLTVSFIKI